MALDSASMYFRAFHGVPDSVTAPDGTPVNAVRGFLDAIARLVSDFSPTSLIAAFDADWRPQWRVDLIPSYKAHRVEGGADAAATGVAVEEVPDLLSPQVPMIEQVLDAIGIARIGVTGFEADDVLGTLAARWPEPVDVVTGDRDLFQVVDDARGIRVLYNARGYAKLEVMDEAAVLARHGVPPQQYADLALLRGDASDGLPGVAGVGEKTAAGLLARFGSVDALLAALDDRGHRRSQGTRPAGSPRLPRVGRAGRARPHRRATSRRRTDAAGNSRADTQTLTALSTQWGLASSVDRLLTAIQGTLR